MFTSFCGRSLNELSLEAKHEHDKKYTFSLPTVLHYSTNFCLKININCGQQVVIILVRGKCQLLNTAD